MATLAYNVILRNNMLNEITAYIDQGAGAGVLRIYDGVQPATCGTATNVLAELTMSDPSAASASSGVWTASAISDDTSANATGTATWARVFDDSTTCVMDMDAGTGSESLVLNSASITAGQNVSVTSFTITAGNA